MARQISWFVVFCCIALALLALVGCGGSNNAPSIHQTYVYSSRGSLNGSGKIEQVKIGDDGSVVPISPVSLDVPFDMSWIAADPSGRFIYTTNFKSSGLIGQFTVSSDGKVRPNSVPTLSFGNRPGPIAFTTDGKYALICSAGNSSISVFRISSDGTLSLVSSVATGASPRSPLITASGYVYVTDQISGRIYEYSLSPTGNITPIGTVQAGNNPNGLALVTNQSLVICANTNSRDLMSFKMNNATGALTLLDTTPLSSNGALEPASVVVDATNSYAYVQDFLAGILRYKINSDGTLTYLGVTKVDLGMDTTNWAIDSSGHNVFVLADNQGDYVYRYRITSDGDLALDGTYLIPGFDISDSITTIRH